MSHKNCTDTATAHAHCAYCDAVKYVAVHGSMDAAQKEILGHVRTEHPDKWEEQDEIEFQNWLAQSSSEPPNDYDGSAERSRSWMSRYSSENEDAP